MRVQGWFRGFCLLGVSSVLAFVVRGEVGFFTLVLTFILLTLDFLWAKNNAGISATVYLDTSSIQAGLKTRLFLEVTNPTRWPVLWVQCWVNLPATFAITDNIGCYNLSLKPSEHKSIAEEFDCHLRGRFSLGASLVRTGGFLGIFVVSLYNETAREIEVLPRLVNLGEAIAVIAGRSLNSSMFTRAVRMSRGNDSAGLMGIREYTNADSMSKIHWKTSARMNNLYVKEFSEIHNFDCTVVLDIRREGYHGDCPDESFEAAVTVAASVAAGLIQRGYGAGFVTCGQHPRFGTKINVGRGHSHLRTILKEMACLTLEENLFSEREASPKGTESDFIFRQKADAGLIVITGNVDDTLTKLVGRLTTRGNRCTVLLVRTGGGKAVRHFHGSTVAVIDMDQEKYLFRSGGPNCENS